GRSTPLSGSLSYAPKEATPKNLDRPESLASYNTPQNLTGVSRPPDDGNVRSIVPPVQSAQPARSLQQVQASRTAAYNASPTGAAVNAPAPIMPANLGAGVRPVIPPGAPQQVQPDRLNMQTLNAQDRLAQLTNNGPGWSQIKN